ncbi:sensor histidine kinase [Streptomyces sp. NPDC056835]|uniref:sensor histidine kinase n=1 Tax=Streptomyces sp. NPDC056835 TaxID=3345956 RepID=UPI0036A37D0C
MSTTMRRPDPGAPTSRGTLRGDFLLSALLVLSAVALARFAQDQGRAPDALGWTLLVAAHVPMVWRRAAPTRSFLAMTAFLVPYHALDYHHGALVAVSMVSLYTFAATQPVLRSLLAGVGVVGLVLTVKFAQGLTEAAQELRVSGWIVAFVAFGICVRYHRQNAAAAVERAVRAERSREEEVRRRVAEERLGIARDLHDLLAHSITLVGVRTSVAAHVLDADPQRLDRAAVARALEEIAETCRSARLELRAALEVLRYGPDNGRDPLPGLGALPDLAAATRASGAPVTLEVPETLEAPPAVGAAAYRIVQEALTNAVRHGGPRPAIRVSVRETDGSLDIEVTNRSAGRLPPAPHPPGFGLIGLREQARSVGGTLLAGPGAGNVFTVRATLPLAGAAGRPGRGLGDAGPTKNPKAGRAHKISTGPRDTASPAGRALAGMITPAAVAVGESGTERGNR